MTKLAARGREAAASLLVPSIALLALSLVLLVAALFPSAGRADEGPAPTAPELSFPSAPLDFGKATLGTETNQVTVSIHNAGTLPTAIDKVTIEGTDPGDFKSSGSNCGWLEPGQDCSAWVTFAPGSLGAKEAIVAVYPKEFPAQTLPISGTGVAPQLAFTPGSYAFGIQRVNRGESSFSFQLANVGEAATQLGSIGIGGKDSSNFWTNGGDCWGGRWLQPGELCNVQVGFNPWDTVAYEAELQAQANGSTFGAGLSGFGGRAAVEPGLNPSEFGAVTVGAEGPVQTIVFTNNGNLPGNFFIGIVAGGDAGSFDLLDESCSAAPVLPASTCTAHVRFVPRGAGPKLARLAFFGDDDGGTMALLSGEGVAPVVTLMPDGFDFGSQPAGSKSAAYVFAVRNDGSTPLELDGAAIVGTDLDQFALAGDECSGTTLAPGAECLLRVRFVPDSEGAKAATLRVRGAGAGFSATLSGRGEPGAGGDEALDRDSFWGSGPGASAVMGDTRPGRFRARHHRFSRGDAVASRRGRVLGRAAVRARTIPR